MTKCSSKIETIQKSLSNYKSRQIIGKKEKCANSFIFASNPTPIGHLQKNNMQVKVFWLGSIENVFSLYLCTVCTVQTTESERESRKCHAYNAYTIQMLNSAERINVINRVGEAKRTEPYTTTTTTTVLYSRRIYICIDTNQTAHCHFTARVCVYI